MRPRQAGELIADPPDGAEPHGVFGVVLDCRANARDVNVDAPVERLERLPPQAVEDRLAREHTPRVAGEQQQEVELVAG